ncbi:SMC-Scp complex subunit ScpB [Sinimarinibacterium sp. CAU 1509]|uniref:SMC-Scp complex subunit ScpB n=1 Tax=Sinimarinibacterium sp. CAU 1509 TaxID=2562283 RepID=UPI0010ABE60F|nr:SMC-Scp complex subunit ScpB [Sinimarinibacterium sp. CAU 1509]TJY62198.1 SMC-Scp complex subunit ScpB [Sinimarinibacterium sp. CAU 1509]
MTEDVALERAAEPLEEINEARDRLLERVLEALLMASDQPLSLEQLSRLLGNELGVGKKDLREALARLSDSLAERAVELREVASGYRIQVRQDYAEWVSKLWQEKPPRLSRALLETLALICYRQPITRGEVEEVRGVALSPNIIRTLLERNWIREVGVKEVPGRPSLFGTTQQFLDDLSLSSLDDLPSLPEIKDPLQLEAALERLGEQLHEVSHVADAPIASNADAESPEALPNDGVDVTLEVSVAALVDAPTEAATDAIGTDDAGDADPGSGLSVDTDTVEVEAEPSSELPDDDAAADLARDADPDADAVDPNRS